MAEIVVPRLGWSMEEGVFVGWLKRDGDLVRAGEPLFTLEGDKAQQEIEALETGVLRVAPDGPKEGDTVAVGAVLGHLEIVGARTPDVEATSGVVASIKTSEVASSSEVSFARSRRDSRIAISPRARRAARERGIDPKQVRGTGRDGRIRERDILACQSPEIEARPEVTSPLRRTIAERMVHSLRSTAPVTLTTTADATNLVRLREQLKKRAIGPDVIAPSFTDLFVKLVAHALVEHPSMNSRGQGDRVEVCAEINIGVAVDTEAGLLVPVIRQAPALPLQQIAQRMRELAEKARRRQLTAEEMQGGTFTITNLGAFGIDAFTPIINWPQCAILGVGRIRRQPAVVEDQIVPRDQVTLSLTFDHRIVDGAPAARFLQNVCKLIETPPSAISA